MALSAFTRSAAAIASFSLGLAAFGWAPARAEGQDQSRAASPPGQVEAQTLGMLDLWSTPARDTGLPADLWRGTSADLVRTTLDQTQDKPLDPALAALLRRALATGASAPDGGGNDQALAGLRERTLLALGDAEGVWTITSRGSGLESSEARSRAKAEAALILGHDQEACDTGAALQENRNGGWWLKLRVWCALVQNQASAAEVALDLWRQAGDKDAAFDRLATAATTGSMPTKTPLKASATDPLNFVLSRKLKLDLVPAMDSAAPAIAAAVARDPAAPRLARLAAAARALRLGVLAPEAAGAVYVPPVTGLEAVTDGPAPPSLDQWAAQPGAVAEAQLWVLAAESADPVARAKAAAAILHRAKGPAEFQALARLVAPAIAFAVKANAPVDDPVMLATAAASAGDIGAANALRGGIEQDKSPDSGPLDLALLDAVIAVSAGKPSGPVLDRLVERGAVGDAKLRARAQAAALILAACGGPMSPQARAQFAAFDTPGAKTAAERTLALSLAGSGKRPGEALILAVSISAQQGGGLSPADRAAAVLALGQAGLADDARAAALEGLIAVARP